MDEHRKHELNTAYHTLCEYMLWRLGRTEKLSADEHEISVALETAAGAILDYIGQDVEATVAQTSLRSAEHELKQQECITESTRMMLDDARAEIRRLKAILASHGIKYGKTPELPPMPKKLTQEVFKNLPDEYKWATVSYDGLATAWAKKPFVGDGEWYVMGCAFTKRIRPRRIGLGYDATDWQNSLLERED